MILQIVDNTIRPELAQNYLNAAKTFAKDSSANDGGCLKMEVFLRQEQPDHVYIVSAWESAAAMQASTTFLQYKAQLKPAFLGNETTILRTAE